MPASQEKHTLSLFWQRAFWVGLLLVFALFSLQYTHKVLHNGSAIVRWQHQILQLEQGDDIYQLYVHPNSPMMVLLLMPLAHMAPLTAALSWFYLKVALTLLALYWVFRLVESPDRPWLPWAKALTVLLSLRPILGDLSHGNINLLILFLVVAALFAFHQGRDWTAGIVLGLAIVCKVTPALFVPYFLWKRAWKTLAGCAAGLVLFLVVVPSGFYGPGHNARLLNSWVEQMIKPYVLRGEVFYSEYSNQSLPGLALRLATHSPSSSHYVNDILVPLDYHNLMTLDPGLLRWFMRGCMAAFALLVVWSCRTPLQPRAGWRLAAEFSLVVLGMLLFSERTWKHHCVTLLLPFAVLCYKLATYRAGLLLRSYVIGSLALAVLLMAATSTGLYDDEAAKLAQVYGAYVWAHLVLVAALVVLLRRRETDTATPPLAEASAMTRTAVSPYRQKALANRSCS